MSEQNGIAEATHTGETPVLPSAAQLYPAAPRELTPTPVTAGGVAVELVALGAERYTVAQRGETKILLENPTGARITVTVETQPSDGSPGATQQHGIPAGERRIIGPFSARHYNPHRVPITPSSAGLLAFAFSG